MYSHLLLNKFCQSSFRICRRSYISFSIVSSISHPHLLKTCFPVSTQIRPFWESFPHVRPLLHEKDGLDKSKYEIVYHTRSFLYVFYGQAAALFFLFSQMYGGCRYVYFSYIAKEVLPIAENIGPFVVNYDMLTIIILGIFNIQNFLIFIAAQTALLRTYYNKSTNEYVFVTLAKNPFLTKLYRCSPGDLKPLKYNKLGFLLGNYELNGKRLFLRFDNFKNMYHYNQTVGYKYEE